MGKREIWIDNVKVIACIFVVLGHFFQSMVKSAILPKNDLYLWFNQTIYYFHVSLFFICSGYLYQRYSKVESFRDWKNNVMKKVLALGIPYFTFSVLTWLLKTIFSGDVNDKVGGIFESLFLEPISPYWYLYCLFIIFVITPTFKNRKIAVGEIIVAFVFKALSIAGLNTGVYAVSLILGNEIWFVLGMCLCIAGFQGRVGRKMRIVGAVAGILFIVLSILVYRLSVGSGNINFFLGLIACASVIVLSAGCFKEKIPNQVFGFFARYTMPIFVMHTIFAATVRSMLLKMGIEEPIIHVTVGIGISFAGPILAAKIMEKFSWLDFFLYPNKYINIRWQSTQK